MKNMLVVLNIPLYDYRSEMLTDMKNIGSRNETRDRVKSDENNFSSGKAYCVIYFMFYNYFHSIFM